MSISVRNQEWLSAPGQSPPRESGRTLESVPSIFREKVGNNFVKAGIFIEQPPLVQLPFSREAITRLRKGGYPQWSGPYRQP
ncbi:hypothetical protein [Pseudomonas sp. Leaf58]|uniref:hypothetical protein n=1 Tax=Pseudomonas sp. Leaf58 TaxID=1736226 RepID=UPI0012E88AFE|nr:hypothetical protein [Pseudomonas sp. Leaf58]